MPASKDGIEIKNAWYWHKHFLFRDKEFTDEVKDFQKELAGGDVVEPRLMEMVYGKELAKRFDSLLKRYKIDYSTYILYFHHDIWGVNAIYPHIKHDGGAVWLRITPSLTKERLRIFWPWIDEVRKQYGGYNKRPTHYTPYAELVYLIEKGLRNGLTYKDIFFMLVKGSYYGYDKPYPFDNINDLKKFHKKYSIKSGT